MLLTIVIGIILSVRLSAQDNCFLKCLENFEKSSLPVPQKNIEILQGLVGCNAPDFQALTIEGKTLNLKELQGKVVVINFWFESCAPCIAELPALNKLSDEYKEKDVVFIAFGKDDTQTIKSFLSKHEFNYQHVASDYNVEQDYCILAGWPTNMVIDKEGVVRKIFSGGYLDERAKSHAYDLMKTSIDKYLEQP